MTETATPRSALRVCYFGTYRAEYSRNQIMVEGLRRAGVEVLECHVPLWTGIEDRVNAAGGGWLRPGFMARVIAASLALIRKHRVIGEYDVMMVGYPGQFDVYLARLLTKLRRKPLVWDIFMSIYLIALERGLDRRSRFTIGAIRRAERIACRLPDRLILDTADYVEWFHRTHGVNPDRFRLVPTGADDRIFHLAETDRPEPHPFTLIYYGTFIRNHGVPVIIEAARRVVDEPDIRFVLVGRGPEKAKAQALVDQYNLTNVMLVDWLDPAELRGYIARADACLGVFGTTPQSMITVQNKIYEALAMRKPLITGDSATVRAAFTHGEHLLLVSRDDSAALAEAIRQLKRDPAGRAAMAERGYQRFCGCFTAQRIGELARAHLESLLAAWRGRN